MNTQGPIRIASSSELAFQVNANGSIRIDHRDVIVNAFLGNEVDGGPTNLFLRRRGAPIEWTPLLGPRSPGAVRLDERGLEVAGEWEGLRFRVSLRLAASAPVWFWHVAVENGGRRSETIDLLYTQDLALTDYGVVRLNEYYISQYVDHTPLVHSAHGAMLAARQNLSVGGRHPWTLIGSLAKAMSFCIDALQLSSDAEFADRSDAPTRYEAVRAGDVGVEGAGAYSSGAGIAVRLVRERLLGLRLRRSSIGIDPVIPRALDGLTARVDIGGRSVEVRYRVGRRGYGPQSLACNGTPLSFTRESNSYREGGAVVAMEAFRHALRDGGNELVVELG